MKAQALGSLDFSPCASKEMPPQHIPARLALLRSFTCTSTSPMLATHEPRLQVKPACSSSELIGISLPGRLLVTPRYPSVWLSFVHCWQNRLSPLIAPLRAPPMPPRPRRTTFIRAFSEAYIMQPTSHLTKELGSS